MPGVVQNPSTHQVLLDSNGKASLTGSACAECCGCSALSGATYLSLTFAGLTICGDPKFSTACTILGYNNLFGPESFTGGVAEVTSLPNGVAFTGTPAQLVINSDVALADIGQIIVPGAILAPAWKTGGFQTYMINTSLVIVAPTDTSPQGVALCARNPQVETSGTRTVIFIRCFNDLLTVEAWMVECLKAETLEPLINKICATSAVPIFFGSVPTAGINLSTGVVIPNSPIWSCDQTVTVDYSDCPYPNPIHSPEIMRNSAVAGGTCTLKSSATNPNPPSAGLECCNFPPCVGALEPSIPTSLCVEPLPTTFKIDISSIELCDTSKIPGCVATCTPGVVTMTLTGSTCADAVYTGVVNDGDGNPCVTVTCKYSGVRWHLIVTDVRCSAQSLMWDGYAHQDATGPCCTYTRSCLKCCGGTDCFGAELTGTNCTFGGGCTSGCDGPCDDGSLPTNNGDGVALSADLSGIVQCDGSALTGLGTATMTRFGGCSGGQFDGGNQGPANVPPADVDANITWADGAGYVLILSALPSSGTLWTGCSDTIEGTYTRVCDGYFGEGVVVCCSTNCDVDSIVVSAA